MNPLLGPQGNELLGKGEASAIVNAAEKARA